MPTTKTKRPTTKKRKPVTAIATRKPKNVIKANGKRHPTSHVDIVKSKRPDIIKLPDGADPKRHIVVDRLLKELVERMTQMQFEFTALASETITDKLYQRHHYQDPDEYFEQRIGFNYRSLRRRLTIAEAFNRLEGADRAECRAALAPLGIHKAAILAPAIGRKGQDWREWVKVAPRLDEDALQDRVSKALGAKPRGRAAHSREGSDVRETSQVWLDDTLKKLPEDARDEVREVFDMGVVLLTNGGKIPRLQVLMNLCREARVEWEAEAREKGWKPKP